MRNTCGAIKKALGPRRLALGCALACALAAAGLAACGANTQPAHRSTSPRPALISSVIRLRAMPTPGAQPYRFSVSHLTAKAGQIQIRFTNADTANVTEGHNMRIQTGQHCCFGPRSRDVGGTQTIDPGTTSVVTVSLRPGRYFFLCSIGGHWQHHMQGILVVT